MRWPGWLFPDSCCGIFSETRSIVLGVIPDEAWLQQISSSGRRQYSGKQRCNIILCHTITSAEGENRWKTEMLNSWQVSFYFRIMHISSVTIPLATEGGFVLSYIPHVNPLPKLKSGQRDVILSSAMQPSMLFKPSWGNMSWSIIEIKCHYVSKLYYVGHTHILIYLRIQVIRIPVSDTCGTCCA